MAEVEKLTTANYVEKVLHSPLPVAVEFYTEWCGYCKRLEPIMEKFKEEAKDRYEVYKVDADKNKTMARRLGVGSYPTVLLYKNGVLEERFVGAERYETYEEAMGRLLSYNESPEETAPKSEEP